MLLSPSTLQDIAQLSEWAAADPHHKGQTTPEWWLTGNGLLSFCVQDRKGPVCFVRLDSDDHLVRIHTQFAPAEDVSKTRLVKAMLTVIPIVIDFAKQTSNGLIFKSVNESLIQFMNVKFGFSSVGDDDYQLNFGVS